MALQQLLEPIETISICDDHDHIELSKPVLTDFSRDMLREVVRSNIYRSLSRMRSPNLEIELGPIL